MSHDEHPDAPGPTAAAVEVFEAERARLTGLAYRMLGSLADAEDVVSEAWVRFQRTDPSTVERPAAWLTTVTSRLAIDRLRSQASRREDYVGPWLPDPVVTSVPGAVGPAPFEDPAERAELSESLTLGFLVVLDRLGPVERAVFLLADVFGEPYAEISRAVGRSEEACRQIASRARRRVREERADRSAADEHLLAGLVGALAVGDVQGLLDLLSPDVVLTSDGGPDRHAARRPVLGPDKVIRLLLNLTGRVPEGIAMEIQHVNAAPALVVHHPDGPIVVSADASDDGRVAAIRVQLNPEKVAALDTPFPGV
ncbi:RNA polymerase sigma factor SigJ [Dermatobacter hominis]|uniref:RNA polymerase sigma factor SigJ n=1 Tax=Dermatobacter hominis TaxID=2884263 RepID=UPI001D120AC0|nr:RNA polymerase sigma factor SigJ [Dermatobacter hominis]UDY35379.1 RNA polymerase sigma factor SigJ [Dermatobacter hominis]